MNEIAQLYGIFLSTVGLGLLINKRNHKRIINDLKNHASVQLIMAMIPLLLGAFLVLEYPSFKGKNLERNLLTVVGWLLMLSGLIRALMPQIMQKVLDRASESCCMAIVFSSILSLLGLGLLFLGFNLHSMV